MAQTRSPPSRLMLGLLLLLLSTLSALAQDDPEVDCVDEDAESYDQAMHIAAVFIIFGTSLSGTIIPIVLHRHALASSTLPLSCGKLFGAGVILATAFVHMFVPATKSLTSDCLDGYAFHDYDAFSGLFALISVALAQLLQVGAAAAMRRKKPFDKFATQGESSALIVTSVDSGASYGNGAFAAHSGHASYQGGKAVTQYATTSLDAAAAGGSNGGSTKAPNIVAVDSYHHQNKSGQPHDNQNHQHHHHHHEEHDDHGHALLFDDTIEKHASTYILELGIAMHSVIIGITLGTATEEFHSLLAALVFHQFFEGMSLSTVVAESRFSLLTSSLMVLFYSLTTPLGVGIGIALHSSYNKDAAATLITTGILDSVSAGILIYDSLVNIITPHVNSRNFRDASFSSRALQLTCMWTGGAIMALIGRWA